MTGTHAKQIGLFMPPTIGFMTDVLTGIYEFIATGVDWSVEVCDTLDTARDATEKWQPDGILINAFQGNWSPLIRQLGVPTVQVGGQVLADVPRVVTDNSAIGRMAAAHFLDRGFRCFGFVGSETLPWARERGEAFVAAVQAAGFSCERYPGNSEFTHAWHVEGSLAEWVTALPKPIAVFACHDRVAHLLSRACVALRVNVPGSVAILGVDNNAIECTFSKPPLSSVMGSARRIGYQGAMLLDQLMRGQADATTGTTHIAPAGVAVRGSTDIFGTADLDLAAALRYIREHAHEAIEVSDVARATIVTRRMLERKFRTELARSPRQQILLAHIECAKDLLINTDLSMLDVALRSGFPSSSKFSTVFRRETTLNPMTFRRLYGQARK